MSLGAGGLFVAQAAPGPSESTIVTVSPERILDTRDPNNIGLAGPFVSAVSQKLKVTGSIPTATGTKTVVPAGATGVLLNVTPVNPTANGFISIRPGDATGAATTSSLNFTTGVAGIVPNAVQVAVPTAGANAGQIDITYDAYGQAGPTTDILIDVVGYMTSAGLQELVADVATKAPRMKTVTVSGFDGTATGPFTLNSINGCARNSDGGSLLLFLPTPVGATISNVTATLYDASGATDPYDVVLRRYTTGSTGDTSAVLSAASGGELSIQTVAKDLTPPSETVDAGERFAVYFTQTAGALNGLCSVAITYQEAATSAPLTQAANDPAGSMACDDPDHCLIEAP